METASNRPRRHRSWSVRRRIKVFALFRIITVATNNREFAAHLRLHPHLRRGSPARARKFQGPILPPCHEVVKYMVPLLLALVILKYEGKPDSLFVDGYPAASALWCFVVSTSVYWVSVRRMKLLMVCNSDSKFCWMLAPTSGVISVSCLISILIPHQVWFRPPHPIWWIFTLLAMIWLLLYGACIYCLQPPTTAVVGRRELPV